MDVAGPGLFCSNAGSEFIVGSFLLCGFATDVTLPYSCHRLCGQMFFFKEHFINNLALDSYDQGDVVMELHYPQCNTSLNVRCQSQAEMRAC